jgi:hypothetical protein
VTVNLMTRIAHEWGVRCFGRDHMWDVKIRALRCAEEAIELAQATNVTKEMMHHLVEQVYARPPGNPVQEAGGTLLTASVICTALNFDPEHVYEIELLPLPEQKPGALCRPQPGKNTIRIEIVKPLTPFEIRQRRVTVTYMVVTLLILCMGGIGLGLLLLR